MCIEVIHMKKTKNIERKGHIIAVTNQKGGTGKTTVTINVGVGLSKMGYKVLVLDNDEQTNLTTGLIVDNQLYKEKNLGNLLDDVLDEKKIRLNRYIIRLRYVDIIAGCRNLFTYKEEFRNRENRNTIYRDVLEQARYKYDFILIDCPPVAGIENAQAYSAADSILVVSEPSMYSMDGIVDAVRIVGEARITENPKLRVLGVVVNKMHFMRREDKGYVQEIRSMCNGKVHVFDNIIPESAAIARCASLGKSILQHRSTSKASYAFLDLAQEIVKEV